MNIFLPMSEFGPLNSSYVFCVPKINLLVKENFFKGFYKNITSSSFIDNLVISKDLLTNYQF